MHCLSSRSMRLPAALLLSAILLCGCFGFGDSDDPERVLRLSIRDGDSLLVWDSVEVRALGSDTTRVQVLFSGKVRDQAAFSALPLGQELGPDFRVVIRGFDAQRRLRLHRILHFGKNRFLSRDSLRVEPVAEIPAEKPAEKPEDPSLPTFPGAAFAGKDLEAGLGDSITVTGRVSAGTAVRAWEWSVDGAPFAPSPDGRRRFRAPFEYRDGLACILRVTDSAGGKLLDTLTVRVSLHWDSVGNNFPVTGGFDAAVWKGKVLVAGAEGLFQSSDLKKWDSVAAAGAFRRREGHTLTAWKERLWMIGGEDADKASRSEAADSTRILSSADGIAWRLDTVVNHMPGRSGHTVTPFTDQLFIAGGCDGTWCSGGLHETADGREWKKVEEVLFTRRGYHSAVFFGNALLLLGGSVREAGQAERTAEKIVVCGALPRPCEETGEFRETEHASVVFNGRAWSFGGRERGEAQVSEDGRTWVSAGASAATRRRRAKAVVFNGRIYVLGGITAQGKSREIWSTVGR